MSNPIGTIFKLVVSPVTVSSTPSGSQSLAQRVSQAWNRSQGWGTSNRLSYTFYAIFNWTNWAADLERNCEEKLERTRLEVAKKAVKTVSETQRRIDEGRAFIDSFKLDKSDRWAPEKILVEKRKEYLPYFLAYLKSVGEKKGQPFVKGMIVFEDPGHRMIDFFVKAEGTYERISSHWKGRRVEEKVYGHDSDQLAEGLRTAHFGKIEVKNNNSEWSFIKPENWGVNTARHKLGHTWDYICTRPAEWRGSESEDHHRRERVSKSVNKAFAQLYCGLTKQKKVPKDLKQAIKLSGISSMVRFLDLHQKTNPQHTNRITNFLDWLGTNYKDHLELRTGREVIITQAELDLSCEEDLDLSLHEDLDLFPHDGIGISSLADLGLPSALGEELGLIDE